MLTELIDLSKQSTLILKYKQKAMFKHNFQSQTTSIIENANI